MFTGIVEEIGQVRHIISGRASGEISVQARRVLEGTRPGDSIAVNGVCLTAARLLPDGFLADVMPETLRRTNLGRLCAGGSVNLERALRADGRLGGHIVTGHIDGTGVLRAARREENAVWLTIEAGREILDGIVEKGSIAVDGVSLTVARLAADSFCVSLIPHTGEHTVLLTKRAGEPVNLETDLIGKYVQKLISKHTIHGNHVQTLLPKHGIHGNHVQELTSKDVPAQDPEPLITKEFLREHGF